MQKGIERLKKTRIYLLNLIDRLTTEQLNEIPAGFNNNIVWNLGHLLATQQSICYLHSDVKIFIDEKYLSSYKPETKPNGFVESIEIQQMKLLFLTAITQFEKDFNDELFSNYQIWTTRYGLEVANIDDAIHFVLFHEGLHTGYIMALNRISIGKV